MVIEHIHSKQREIPLHSVLNGLPVKRDWIRGLIALGRTVHKAHSHCLLTQTERIKLLSWGLLTVWKGCSKVLPESRDTLARLQGKVDS